MPRRRQGQYLRCKVVCQAWPDLRFALSGEDGKHHRYDRSATFAGYMELMAKQRHDVQSAPALHHVLRKIILELEGRPRIANRQAGADAVQSTSIRIGPGAWRSARCRSVRRR